MIFEEFDILTTELSKAAKPFANAKGKRVVVGQSEENGSFFIACVDKNAPYVFEKIKDHKWSENVKSLEKINVIVGLNILYEEFGWQYSSSKEYDKFLSIDSNVKIVEAYAQVNESNSKEFVKKQTFDFKEIFYFASNKKNKEYLASRITAINPTFVGRNYEDMARQVVDYCSDIDDKAKSYFTKARLLSTNRRKASV